MAEAESMGRCSRCQGSHARDAVVDVEVGVTSVEVAAHGVWGRKEALRSRGTQCYTWKKTKRVSMPKTMLLKQL